MRPVRSAVRPAQSISARRECSQVACHAPRSSRRERSELGSRPRIAPLSHRTERDRATEPWRFFRTGLRTQALPTPPATRQTRARPRCLPIRRAPPTHLRRSPPSPSEYRPTEPPSLRTSERLGSLSVEGVLGWLLPHRRQKRDSVALSSCGADENRTLECDNFQLGDVARFSDSRVRFRSTFALRPHPHASTSGHANRPQSWRHFGNGTGARSRPRGGSPLFANATLSACSRSVRG